MSLLCDPRFGVPEVGKNYDIIKTAKELKKNIMTHESDTIMGDTRKLRQYFPVEIKELAEDCWRTKDTITDPALQRRRTAASEGIESTPFIYQHLSDEESYQAFRENYEDKVFEVLQKECQQKLSKLPEENPTERQQRWFY